MAGYFNYSKSNNAIYAESQGRYPATKCAKIYGFKSAKAVRESMRSTEWHHTSKRYNITDFFDFPSELENACDLTDLNKFHSFLKKDCKARDLIWETGRELIKKNLDNSPEIIQLRSRAGFYKDRGQKIKRKFY
jgi:hypothetical protein